VPIWVASAHQDLAHRVPLDLLAGIVREQHQRTALEDPRRAVPASLDVVHRVVECSNCARGEVETGPAVGVSVSPTTMRFGATSRLASPRSRLTSLRRSKPTANQLSGTYM
jgi:hypothetical protein